VQAAVAALPPFPLGQSGVRGPIARELARWAATVPPGSVAAVAALGHRTVVEVLPERVARVRWRRSGAVGPLPPDAPRRVLVEVADGTGR